MAPRGDGLGRWHPDRADGWARDSALASLSSVALHLLKIREKPMPGQADNVRPGDGQPRPPVRASRQRLDPGRQRLAAAHRGDRNQRSRPRAAPGQFQSFDSLADGVRMRCT